MPSLRHHGPLRVLLVEDEPRLRQFLIEEIAQMGFVAGGAGSAEEARRLMDTNPADILLLDLQLPGMGGMEFFRIVRQRWAETAVIVLTGYGALEMARQAIHLDVVDFLTKPCPLGELEAALDRAARRQRGLPFGVAATSPEPCHNSSADAVTLSQHEQQVILDTLRRLGGNRSATAAELGISRRTLQYRLAEYKNRGIPFEADE